MMQASRADDVIQVIPVSPDAVPPWLARFTACQVGRVDERYQGWFGPTFPQLPSHLYRYQTAEGITHQAERSRLAPVPQLFDVAGCQGFHGGQAVHQTKWLQSIQWLIRPEFQSQTPEQNHLAVQSADTKDGRLGAVGLNGDDGRGCLDPRITNYTRPSSH